MDIFAHGLWTGALYKGLNKTRKKSLSVRMAIFWGIFPDIFAFSFLFLAASLGSLFGPLPFIGEISFKTLPGPHELEPLQRDTIRVFDFTKQLYNISHSLVIFFVVFLFGN